MFMCTSLEWILVHCANQTKSHHCIPEQVLYNSIPGKIQFEEDCVMQAKSQPVAAKCRHFVGISEVSAWCEKMSVAVIHVITMY